MVVSVGAAIARAASPGVSVTAGVAPGTPPAAPGGGVSAGAAMAASEAAAVASTVAALLAVAEVASADRPTGASVGATSISCCAAGVGAVVDSTAKLWTSRGADARLDRELLQSTTRTKI